MALRPALTRTFHRCLYGPYAQTVIILKRNDDQQEGTVRSLKAFNCLLPGTLVDGDFERASKVYYSGEAIELFHGSGRNLRCTGNHPIFTSRGKVPANYIQPGFDLVTDLQHGVGSTDKENCPSTVEQVFEAFSKSGSVSSVLTTFDFHGDSKFCVGEVQTIWSNRELTRELETEFLEDNFQFVFSSAYTESFAGDSGSMLALGCERPESWMSVLGSLDGIPSLFFSSFRPPQLLDFFFRPKPGLSCLEYSTNPTFAVSDTFGNRFNGFPANIGLGDFCHRSPGLFSNLPQPSSFGGRQFLDAHFSGEFVEESRNSQTSFVGKVPAALPSEVSLSKVTKIRHFHYDGPVYDFGTTTTGYYTANGVFVGNCWRSGTEHKTGEPIQHSMSVGSSVTWHIPVIEMRRLGIRWFNNLDRIVDSKTGYYWQPEATTPIDDKTFHSFVRLECLRVDPPCLNQQQKHA